MLFNPQKMYMTTAIDTLTAILPKGYHLLTYAVFSVSFVGECRVSCRPPQVSTITKTDHSAIKQGHEIGGGRKILLYLKAIM